MSYLLFEFRPSDFAMKSQASRRQIYAAAPQRNLPGALPCRASGRILRGNSHDTLDTSRERRVLDFHVDDTAELEAELARLKQEHRDLDTAIEALERMVAGDQLQIQRLKKRKLVLKDRIMRVEDQITPDIIA